MGELSVSDSFQKIFWADCSRTAAACPHACLDLSDEARKQSYSLVLYFWGGMTAATRLARLHEAPLSCGSVQKFALTLHLLFSTCSISLMQGAGQGKHAGWGSLLKIPPEVLSFVFWDVLLAVHASKNHSCIFPWYILYRATWLTPVAAVLAQSFKHIFALNK